MLLSDVLQGAVDHLQQEELGKGFGTMGIRVIPIAVLGRRGTPVAVETGVALGVQVQADLTTETGQMAQAQGLALTEKLSRFATAAMTDGKALGELDVNPQFALGDLGLQDAHNREVQ